MTGPLYRDPVEDGAADPKVIWNPREREWWMFYTARRTRTPENGVGWVHGTGIGVASSADHGATWTYRGQVAGLETDWGTNTFWAPEIVEENGVFHMFVSWIRGMPTSWVGHRRLMRHYTSPDLVAWEYAGEVPLGSEFVIDAGLHRLPGGGWRMWYKDEADGSSIWAADSDDLVAWEVRGPVLRPPFAVEGPDVFRLAGRYWMIVDAKQQLLYRSDDLEEWEHVDTLLDAASGLASGRVDDLGPGLHGSVVVAGESAWLFYFTHPDRHRPDLVAPDHRRSSIQVAELVPAGDTLACERSDRVVPDLRAAETDG